MLKAIFFFKIDFIFIITLVNFKIIVDDFIDEVNIIAEGKHTVVDGLLITDEEVDVF